MKTFVCLVALAVVMVLNAGFASGDPIIVDHTCTDITKIPDYWLERARENMRVGYGHTSHGSQPVSGIFALRGEEGSTYYFTYSGSGLQPGIFLNDYWGNAFGAADLGGDSYLGWRDATITGLSQANNDRNVVMWSWCGGVSGNSEAGIKTYLDAMNALENTYPGVKFVYMTGHLDGGGAAGNLHVRNEQIRTYCRDHDKILFDFADIESFDPDGGTNFMSLFANDNCDYQGGKNWAVEWINANPNSELAKGTEKCGECAHSQKLNCILKGQAFWWLMARLAGWEGASTAHHKLRVDKPGDGKGTITAQGLKCGNKSCTGTFGENAVITVTAQALSGSLFQGWSGCEATVGNSCSVTMTADVTVTATFLLSQKIAVSPGSLALGNVKKGVRSKSGRITVTNKGSNPLAISAIDITGTSSSATEIVADTCTSEPIEKKGTCYVDVAVNPTTYGSLSSIIQIVSDDPKKSVTEVKVAGRSVPPKIVTAPGTVDFGSRTIGVPSTPKLVRVTNRGLSDFSISGIGVAGAASPFSLTGNGCPGLLTAGQTCTLTIAFAPDSKEKEQDTLEIRTADPELQTVVVKLSGKGK